LWTQWTVRILLSNRKLPPAGLRIIIALISNPAVMTTRNTLVFIA
jgi:hypothetical protein